MAQRKYRSYAPHQYDGQLQPAWYVASLQEMIDSRHTLEEDKLYAFVVNCKDPTMK